MAHGHYVALFDVLGFADRLDRLGLDEILSRYESLIEAVNYRAFQEQKVFDALGFEEAPYWSSEGNVVVFTKIRGTYASDSILLWSSRTWPEVANESDDSFRKFASSTTDGWKYHPIPCDNFLNVCNEIMCRGLEVGLPLRGAIAIGDAVLDQDKRIFLGKPIVEAARLEGGQNLIGTSFCTSMVGDIVPPRYFLKYDRHIKESHRSIWGSGMLDWPRHWRRTRKADLATVISALNTNPTYSNYYENTLDLVAYSERFADQYEDPRETSIRSQYAQFSWSNADLSVKARAVREMPSGS